MCLTFGLISHFSHVLFNPTPAEGLCRLRYDFRDLWFCICVLEFYLLQLCWNDREGNNDILLNKQSHEGSVLNIAAVREEKKSY